MTTFLLWLAHRYKNRKSFTTNFPLKEDKIFSHRKRVSDCKQNHGKDSITPKIEIVFSTYSTRLKRLNTKFGVEHPKHFSTSGVRSGFWTTMGQKIKKNFKEKFSEATDLFRHPLNRNRDNEIEFDPNRFVQRRTETPLNLPNQTTSTLPNSPNQSTESLEMASNTINSERPDTESSNEYVPDMFEGVSVTANGLKYKLLDIMNDINRLHRYLYGGARLSNAEIEEKFNKTDELHLKKELESVLDFKSETIDNTVITLALQAIKEMVNFRQKYSDPTLTIEDRNALTLNFVRNWNSYRTQLRTFSYELDTLLETSYFGSGSLYHSSNPSKVGDGGFDSGDGGE